MTKTRLDYFITLMVAFPAVIIGAVAMRIHNVQSIYFILNIGFLFIGWLISCFAISKPNKIRDSKNYGMILNFLILVLLALTFIDQGTENVHRWLSLGPIRLYVSSIFTPLLLVDLWTQQKNKNSVLAGVVTLIVAFLLLLQPDASQLTAFAVPMMIILIKKINSRVHSFSIISILTLMVIVSWINLDSLPAVVYVEEILKLVMDMDLIWSILGIVSLLILPMPFFFLTKSNNRTGAMCIGLYYVILLITTFFGNFPVPLMGYGISPIIGYIVAMTWLIKNK